MRKRVNIITLTLFAKPISESIIGKYQRRVDEVGWKGMPEVLGKSAFRQTKYFLKKLYFKGIIQNETIAANYPFEDPVTLLLGNPRSGTSWTATVLNRSLKVAYLNEPVNLSLIHKSNLTHDVNPLGNGKGHEEYNYYADQAFSGIPPTLKVANDLSDFYPFARRDKTLLIKEVLLYDADFFAKMYSPKIIILLRHPAAIADSYYRMGWIQDDEFEKLGCWYGEKMSRALKAIKQQTCIVRFYENLALNPRKEFSELFEFMNIDKPADFDAIIEEYSENKNKNSNPHRVKRISENEVHKWKKNLDKEEAEAVRKGYFRWDPEYYRNIEDWIL